MLSTNLTQNHQSIEMIRKLPFFCPKQEENCKRSTAGQKREQQFWLNSSTVQILLGTASCQTTRQFSNLLSGLQGFFRSSNSVNFQTFLWTQQKDSWQAIGNSIVSLRVSSGVLLQTEGKGKPNAWWRELWNNGTSLFLPTWCFLLHVLPNKLWRVVINYPMSLSNNNISLSITTLLCHYFGVRLEDLG